MESYDTMPSEFLERLQQIVAELRFPSATGISASPLCESSLGIVKDSA
jgi:hypothetical protein